MREQHFLKCSVGSVKGYFRTMKTDFSAQTENKALKNGMLVRIRACMMLHLRKQLLANKWRYRLYVCTGRKRFNQKRSSKGSTFRLVPSRYYVTRHWYSPRAEKARQTNTIQSHIFIDKLTFILKLFFLLKYFC